MTASDPWARLLRYLSGKDDYARCYLTTDSDAAYPRSSELVVDVGDVLVDAAACAQVLACGIQEVVVPEPDDELTSTLGGLVTVGKVVAGRRWHRGDRVTLRALDMPRRTLVAPRRFPVRPGDDVDARAFDAWHWLALHRGLPDLVTDADLMRMHTFRCPVCSEQSAQCGVVGCEACAAAVARCRRPVDADRALKVLQAGERTASNHLVACEKCHVPHPTSHGARCATCRAEEASPFQSYLPPEVLAALPISARNRIRPRDGLLDD